MEIQVPPAKRVFGYYVLPFLRNDRLVLNVDLKADREARVLRVRAAYREAHAADDDICPQLACELREMSGWLGLERVIVELLDNLARGLSAA